MDIIKVKTLTDIKEGDTICITGDNLFCEPFKAHKVKVSESDGTEVIFDIKQNRFFNVGMYLYNNSWVKEVVIIK
jgi:hypothetical protein